MRRVGLLVVVVLAAGSAGAVAPADGSGLSRDLLGWEAGHWHDDPLSVTVEDGLNATEREAIVGRTMARIEHLRGLEFRESVDVRVETREQFRANRTTERNATHERWNNQVWKAPFLVGDDRDVGDVFDSTFGATVVGYYEAGSGDIVIVSDDGASLSRGTLVHELVHALQDQHVDFARRPDTQDRQLAWNAVIEGEANWLVGEYDRRCGVEWECLTMGRATGTSATDGPYEDNVFLVIFHPYASGPEFVERAVDRGGAAAVDALYDDLPESTEQVIHPGAYPDERPANVTVPDRSDGDWHRLDHDPVADTVGEATIYAMAVVHDLGEAPDDRYSYRHPVSAGWGGDALVPYRNGDRNGYVWTTVWDSSADAREFHDAYRELVASQGATELGPGRYRLPADAPFGGAYRLTREAATVRVVHGPTPDSLRAIHAP